MTARDDIGEVALRVTVRFEERPRLERGDAHRVGPERRDIVRIVLESEDLVGVADGRLAEGVDEGRVDVADLEADPRLVERPGAVHLDVRFDDGRPGADGVERADEGERRAGEVIAAPRHGEADLFLRDPRAPDGLVHYRKKHLDFVVERVGGEAGGLGEGDDGYVSQLHSVLVGVVGGVRLGGWAKVPDALERRAALLGGRPHGLDADTHADPIDGYFLNEMEEGDIGAVEEDRGADVGYVDGGAGEGDVAEAKG